MKKHAKIAAVLAAITLVSHGIAASATQTNYCRTIDNVTVTFAENTEISYEKQELAARKIFELCGVSVDEPENTITAQSVLCTLFGHDKKVSTSISMMHKVYATQPRCRKITYEVTTCSRCTDYVETVVVSEERTICCPND